MNGLANRRSAKIDGAAKEMIIKELEGPISELLGRNVASQ